MIHIRPFAVAASLATILAVVLTSCGQPPQPPPMTSTVIIAGATGNEPLINDLAPYLAGIGEGSTVAILTDEGKPKVLATETLGNLSNNDTERADQIRALSDGALKLVSKATATSPEQNPMEALSLGASIIQAAQGKKQLIFTSSMLQTVGDFLMQNGLLDAQASDVVAALKARGSLPPLKDVLVILAGLGQVQGSQSIDADGRAKLTEFWVAILTASGATVKIAPPSATTPRTNVKETVTPVQFQSNPVTVKNCRTVLSATQVGFLPGTAQFRDPSAAQRTIKDVVALLRGCHGQVTITGTTSSEGTAAGNRHLAAARAQAVAQILAAGLHTVPTDFVIRGLGYDMASNTVVNDRAADGSLEPVLANSNRKVVISVGQLAAS